MTISAQFVGYIELLATLALLFYASYEDIQQRIIDDWVTISIAIVWLCGSVCNILLRNCNFLDILLTSVWSLFVLFVLLALAHIFEHHKKRDVVGGGDIKLLAALALYLNLDNFLLMLLISCLSGIILAFIFSRVKIEDGQSNNFMTIELPWIPSITIGFIVVELLILF